MRFLVLFTPVHSATLHARIVDAPSIEDVVVAPDEDLGAIIQLPDGWPPSVWDEERRTVEVTPEPSPSSGSRGETASSNEQ